MGLPSPKHSSFTDSPLLARMRPSSGNRRTWAGSEIIQFIWSSFKVIQSSDGSSNSIGKQLHRQQSLLNWLFFSDKTNEVEFHRCQVQKEKNFSQFMNRFRVEQTLNDLVQPTVEICSNQLFQLSLIHLAAIWFLISSDQHKSLRFDTVLRWWGCDWQTSSKMMKWTSTENVKDDSDVEWYIGVDFADIDAGVFGLDIRDFDGRLMDGETCIAGHLRCTGGKQLGFTFAQFTPNHRIVSCQFIKIRLDLYASIVGEGQTVGISRQILLVVRIEIPRRKNVASGLKRFWVMLRYTQISQRILQNLIFPFPQNFDEAVGT